MSAADQPPHTPDPPDDGAGGAPTAKARPSARPAPVIDPLARVRHDLRTPINQIIGYSELLREEAEERGMPDFVDDLGKIRLAARRMLEHVEAFFAAPGALRPHDMADALAQLAGNNTPRAGVERDAELELGEAAPRAEHAGARILVVDDQELNREMLARRLRARGYVVDTAVDGADALAKIAAGDYALVLLDVMMPGISGFEVLSEVRRRWSAADLPVIMATAVSGGGDIVEALRLGANDYVTKPIDFPVALARIETQLTLKRAKERVEHLARDLEVRNGFIRDVFGRYISDEVVESLLASDKALELGGEKRAVTILMTDLRGFTPLVERLAPEQVVRLLNTYLGVMAEIIARYQGTINEFIGDAILVLFGAPIQRPDDARRAVACALAMQLAMDDVNERCERAGLPRIEMGASLTTGEVVVGNIGSHKRVKYGVVGSQVNLAARMESHTVGGQILISSATRAEAGDDLALGAELVLRAKGFREPIKAYELQGLGGEHQLFLPDRRADAVPLARPVPVRFQVVTDKTVDEEMFAGAFTRVWAGGAELRCEAPPPALTNLKVLVVDGEGALVPGDLYVKITAVRETDAACVVRFTSVPSEVATHLKQVVSSARG